MQKGSKTWYLAITKVFDRRGGSRYDIQVGVSMLLVVAASARSHVAGA